ncbi:hypothetical protein GA0061102_102691 [Rhizobium miluonense]|uniref:Uncharacterized protein n=1 Tax=Rhizobium miluonense TaxID=411945 RepID=A0A1C3WCI0_9HYPH|nr:hypothetical protein GA0061102_102691 [Rhizobium miluonense]
MDDFQGKPLTLALSPQAGRGDDLLWSMLSILAKVRDDRGGIRFLLPFKTGRRWPTGRMRGVPRPELNS